MLMECTKQVLGMKSLFSKGNSLLKLDYAFPESASNVYAGSLLGILFIQDTYGHNDNRLISTHFKAALSASAMDEIGNQKQFLKCIDLLALIWKALDMKWISIASSLAALVELKVNESSWPCNYVVVPMFERLQSEIRDTAHNNGGNYQKRMLQRSPNRLVATSTGGLRKF